MKKYTKPTVRVVDLLKLAKVMDSCVTKEQMVAGAKYRKLFLRKFELDAQAIRIYVGISDRFRKQRQKLNIA